MLILIRGWPGSGKSTLAKQFDAVLYEADQWRVNEAGEYVFRAEDNKMAHEACFKATEDSLCHREDVVVANTFIKLWELKPYVDLAWELSTPLVIINCLADFPNVHGVPDEVIERMKGSFEYDFSSLLRHPPGAHEGNILVAAA